MVLHRDRTFRYDGQHNTMKWSHLIEVSRRDAMRKSVPLYKDLLRNLRHIRVAMKAFSRGRQAPRAISTLAKAIFRRKNELKRLNINTMADANGYAEGIVASLMAAPGRNINLSLRKVVADMYE